MSCCTRSRTLPTRRSGTVATSASSCGTELKEAWESTELEAEGLVDAGDHVVAGILSHGVMRGTEDELEMRLGMTFAFREGQITELRFYRSFAEALEAAGLRE